MRVLIISFNTQKKGAEMYQKSQNAAKNSFDVRFHNLIGSFVTYNKFIITDYGTITNGIDGNANDGKSCIFYFAIKLINK